MSTKLKNYIHLTYSYDTRGAHSDAPSHWKDDEILESRASFRRKGEPDELLINPVLVSMK